MDMGEIINEQIGHVMLITIANERKRNAINMAMEHRLIKAFRECDERDDIRAVVITGAGDIAFCSGHDLNELGKPGSADLDPCGYPARMRKPVIAAINGHCHAAGLLLALSCDLRIASKNAVFGQPGAKLGMLPVGRQIMNLPRVMPPVAALEMMMTAEPMPASRASSLGFLNQLVPAGKAKEQALVLASRITANSPAAVQAIKEGWRVSQSGGIAEFDTFEKEMSDSLMGGPDAAEGALAFREKRAPRF
jgi:enoyl-CoA hydratase/carnithine racemase